MSLKRTFLALATILTCSFSNVVSAHPHAWYDIKVTIVNQNPAELKINSKDYGVKVEYPTIADSEEVTPIYGFIFTMYLDKISSAPVIVDIKKGRVKNIWAELATNLVSAKFFTKLTVYDELNNHKKLSEPSFTKAISMIDVSFTKENALVLKYFAPLKEPLLLKNGEYVSMQTYDNTYYIDMSYKNFNDISFSKADTKVKCNYLLEASSPDVKLIDYASALRPDENPNDPDFGRKFAQTLYFGCPFSH